VHDELPGWIEDTVHAICRGYGGEARVRYRCISPPVHNDPGLTDLVEEAAITLIGASQVRRLHQPSLGAEDFAQLLTVAPGTMFRLGVAGAEGCAPLHNGTFNPDERSLAVGIEVLTLSLLLWMERQI
jgi:metal-dependent amidase/aminoacylase/carboxypeptidase family protein